MARHQGLSFCDWEFEEIRRQAAELFDELARRWSRLRIVFSGRGFHVHVFDADAFRLSRKERGGIAASLARRYAIDEWVTSGEMRLIRLPFSLHGMVSRIVIPVPRRRLESFSHDDSRAVPRFRSASHRFFAFRSLRPGSTAFSLPPFCGPACASL